MTPQKNELSSRETIEGQGYVSDEDIKNFYCPNKAAHSIACEALVSRAFTRIAL